MFAWFLTALVASSLADEKPAFRLVGLYDASAVLRLGGNVDQDFKWTPSAEMKKSCGPEKKPEKYGMFEAEAVTNKMSPTLAIILEHNDKTKYLDHKKQPCNPKRTPKNCDPVIRAPVVPDDVTIGLGIGKIDFQLHPMVNPRYLAIDIDGYVDQSDFVAEKDNEGADEGEQGAVPNSPTEYDTTRYQKLIRTQLEIALCLEHKVGRGWIGNDKNRLRQAFLLDPPDSSDPFMAATNNRDLKKRTDRLYFNGQRDPVPALIGAPAACIRSRVEAPRPAGDPPGSSSLWMTPSDIWGASLKECSLSQLGGSIVTEATKNMPLTMSENGVRLPRKIQPRWSPIKIEIKASGNEEKDVSVNVLKDNKVVKGLENTALFPNAGKSDDPAKNGAMLDILASIEHTYPIVGTKDDPSRYVVLMVPNWQIVEGLRRMYSRDCTENTPEKYCKCTVKSFDAPFSKTESTAKAIHSTMYERLHCVDHDNKVCTLSTEPGKNQEVAAADKCLEKLRMDRPMTSGRGKNIFDGVGWILANPNHLFIQVHTLTEQTEKKGFQILDYLPFGSAESANEKKPNLTGVVKGDDPISMREWGYTVGLLAGRSPIVTADEDRLSWKLSASAQRATQQSYFVIAVVFLFGFVILGMRRLSDYWTNTPEERAYYWPGRQADNEMSEPEGVELEGGGAEA